MYLINHSWQKNRRLIDFILLYYFLGIFVSVVACMPGVFSWYEWGVRRVCLVCMIFFCGVCLVNAWY